MSSSLNIAKSFDLLDLQLILFDSNLCEILFWAKLLIICLNIILILCCCTCLQCFRFQQYRKSKWTDPLFSDKILIQYLKEDSKKTIYQRFRNLIWCCD
uniref:Uncharacterized protein n=1 Tax=Panagrolaimus sp. PS1159 TaxID=55785 RepID=A0AC35F921_9BILA